MGVARKMLNWYARLAPSHGKSSPPYEHVVQVGDPILRKIAQPVPLDKIKTPEIQTLINKLHYVLNKYGSLGMSAPQIGVSQRIFVMKCTALQVAETSKDSAKSKGMTVVPFSVFINPKVKVIDYTKIVHTEGCESVQGYVADVPRYREIEVTGYNAEGENTSLTCKDWTARIVQHEMSHLDGNLFTDIMDKRTLTCVCWEQVNMAKGNVEIPFYRK